MSKLTLGIATLALLVAVIAVIRTAPSADAFAATDTTNALAGVFAGCGAGPTEIHSSFNNVNSDKIKIVADTPWAGSCDVIFPFKITGHVAVVSSASGNISRFATVTARSRKKYVVTIFNETGAVDGGAFYLVVY